MQDPDRPGTEHFTILQDEGSEAAAKTKTIQSLVTEKGRRIVLRGITTMELPHNIIDTILEADSKALATMGESDINVVPVSTMFVNEGKILLVNYFFRKTAENIQRDPRVALACWKGTEGYQIKGYCDYRTDRTTLAPIKKWAAEQFPDRTVYGLLIITPHRIYKIAASSQSGHLVWPGEET